MTKVILVYANCYDPNAKGDFSLAANAAKDIALELQSTASDQEVILTSNADDLWKYYALYGNPMSGKIVIDGVSLKVQALEMLDAINHEVSAIVEAGCKLPASEVVKRVLTAQSKIIILLAANQPISDFASQISYLNSEQPGLCPYFADVHVLTSGLGSLRDGLPNIKKNTELASLSEAEQGKIPRGNYGFGYFNVGDPILTMLQSTSVAQYMKLANQTQYVLVGDFADKKWIIDAALIKAFPAGDIPTVHFYPSLNNLTMRHIVQKGSLLVGTTGVMSALETMHDGKLPYYQYFRSNRDFVSSYLDAVHSAVGNRSYLERNVSEMVIALAQILFKPKPLCSNSSLELEKLLRKQTVTNELIAVNHQIIDQASGKMVGSIMRVLNATNMNSTAKQIPFALSMLCKPGETSTPQVSKGLRRAAFWCRPFELRVLLQTTTLDEINSPDSAEKQRTPLHWAVLGGSTDCVALLLQAKANLNSKDKSGKTPLDYAKNESMVSLLTSAGGKYSKDLPDPQEESMQENVEIHTCQTQKGEINSPQERTNLPSLPNDDVIEIQHALFSKINDYIRWSKNKDKDDGRHYALGFFSKWRHGEFGIKRAEELMRCLSKAGCKKEIIETLRQHFTKDSKLNNHSLDTYLLEAVDNNQDFFKTPGHCNLRNQEERVSLRDAFCNCTNSPAFAG
jgi:hypothetical protein